MTVKLERVMVHRNVLGVDIGGTKIAVGVVTPEGQVVARQSAPTPIRPRREETPAAIVATVVALCRELLAKTRQQPMPLAAVGVGTAGEVNRDAGVISYASENLPGWTGTPVARLLQKALDLPAVVENDVNAMALGESRFGAGRGLDHVLYVTVGTGIGGALIQDSALWSGATWTAGEIAHTVIDWDGDQICSCGRPGHLEAYTCGPAMTRRYARLSGSAAPDLREVARRAGQGDPLAIQAIAEGARVLGIGLGGLLCLVDPQALIVGGGVSELGDLWWQPFLAGLRDNPMPGPAAIPVHRAALGPDAVLIGAAWLAFKMTG